MTRYKLFLIVFMPIVLQAVTFYWFLERPRYTWKEMFMNCWEAK